MKKTKILKFLVAPMLVVGVLCSSGIGLYVNAVSQNAETEVKEILGNKQVPYLDKNHSQVCMGGGWKNANGNPYQTGKKNQNPEGRQYWNPQRITSSTTTPFNDTVNEQQLINMYWPKNTKVHINSRGSNYWIDLSRVDKLYDAVLDPEDDCYYANPNNGWGMNVEPTKAEYLEYNADWSAFEYGHGTTPYADPKGKTRIDYAGNYIFRIGINTGAIWDNPFTIVARAKIELSATTSDFYANTKSPKMPVIFDKTEAGVGTLDAGTLYEFKGTGSVTGQNYYNEYPRTPGKYTLTAQSAPDKSRFKLPGRATKSVNVMKKGYKTKFQKNIDGSVTTMSDTDWNPNSKPSDPDGETKGLFGVDLYLENQKYTVPIPKYDSSKYIFEGWTVTEEYATSLFEVKTREFEIYDDDKDGRYEYTPSHIGENAYYVLSTTITANIRSKKTDTIKPVTQVDGGDKIEAGISVAPSEIKITEGTENRNSFTASVTTGYAYDFMGWSYNQSGNHIDLGTEKTYQPATNFAQQGETHKNSTLYATFKPKEYTITFDGNGGTESGSQSTTSTQKASYYNDVKLQKNPFVREGFRFKGWSTSKTSSAVKYTDQATDRNIPLDGLNQALNNDIPQNITLYAVWERTITNVDVQKYKDTLWLEGNHWGAAAANVFVKNSNQGYNAYELIRYYLDIDMKDFNIPVEQLDKSKFYVVWERSTDGGSNYQKIPLDQYQSFFTAPFSDAQRDYSKVVYDEEKGQWFVPLLVKAGAGSDADTIGGHYKVSVAYDDPQATEKVASEQDFYNNVSQKGWTTSEPTEVKMIRTFETVVNVPANVILEEKTEITPDGSTKQVVESVHSSNKVTVNPI